MDCRKGLLFFAGLLVPLSGCTLRPSGEVRRDAGGDAGEEVMKKPETFVAFADYRAAAAFAKETPPQAQAGFREEARIAYLKAIEIEPKHVPAYLALARLQQANKDMAPALETYRKALEVTTRDATVWYEMGMCQARQKQFDESAASLRKACELRPDDKRCRETLGHTLARAGRWAEGLAELTAVVGEARANFYLARMQQHMNQPEEARKYAATALARDPELPGARELLLSLGGTAPPSAAPAAPTPGHTALKPSSASPEIQITAVGGQSVTVTPADGDPAPRGSGLPPRPVTVVQDGTR